METRNKGLRNMTLSALFLALAYVLPFFTGNIPQIGSMLLPMHIPVILCGFICGGGWGMAVGFIAPLLRCALVGAPMFTMAVSMAIELMFYGLVSGLLYRRLPKNIGGVYASLIIAMVAGRIAYGAVQMVMMTTSGDSYLLSMFVASTVTGSIPGIILQLILIPTIILALQRAGVNRDGKN